MFDNTSDLLTVLAVALGGGIGVSLVSQLIKKIFGLQSSAVIHTVVVTLSAVAAGLQYFEQIHGQLPPAVLGLSTTMIYGFSQMLYKYVGYASEFVGKVNAYNAYVGEQKKSIEQQLNPQPVPEAVETAPVAPAPEPTPAPVNEFQF